MVCRARDLFWMSQEAKTTVHVRLDRNRLAFGGDAAEKTPPVLTLTFAACGEPARTFAALREGIGSDLYYEVFDAEPRTSPTPLVVLLGINYSVNEFETRCGSVHQAEFDYTVNDLKAERGWLRREYEATYQREQNIKRRYRLATSGLVGEIERELNRCARKLAFFAQTNPARAEAVRGEIKAYERVLTLIAHGQQNDKDYQQP